MAPKSCTRHWAQIYTIYGIENIHTLIILIIHSFFFTFLTLYLHRNSTTTTTTLTTILTPCAAARATVVVTITTTITSIVLIITTINFIYSSLPLRWSISQQMITYIPDWSTVRTALDIECGRGILLNAIALHLKKHGSPGRVVGLDRTRPGTMRALRAARVEGVQEYVTCREGDVRRLPFNDEYFDVVVSAAAIRRVAAERDRVIEEMVRVLKPGGVGVAWEMHHVSDYVKKLHELGIDDIRVSRRVPAYMVSSHIVSFRKPDYVGSVYEYDGEVKVDLRCYNMNDIC